MAIQWGLLASLADKFGENYDSARKARLQDLQMQASGESAKAWLDSLNGGAPAAIAPGAAAPADTASAPVAPTVVDQPAGPAAKLPTFARIERGQPSSDIMGLVRSTAAASNLSPDYLSRMVQIESGGDPNAQNASGARGLLQFIPSTWKQYAHLGSPFDPNAALTAGADFTAKNRSYLAQKLGRDPTWGETYLAHQQGAGGAAALLSNPNGRAADTVGYKAVLANLPSSQKSRAATMTNKEFADLWTSRFADIDQGTAQAAAPVRVAAAGGSFAPTVSGVAPTDPAERTRALTQGAGYSPIAVPPKPSATSAAPIAPTQVAPTQVAQAAPTAPVAPAAPGQAAQPNLAMAPPTRKPLPEPIQRMLQSTNYFTQRQGVELAKKYAADTEWSQTQLQNGAVYWINKQGQSVFAGMAAKPQTDIVPHGSAVLRDNKLIFVNPDKPETHVLSHGQTIVTNGQPGYTAPEAPEKELDARRKVIDARENWRELGFRDPNDPANAAWWEEKAANIYGGGKTGTDIKLGDNDEVSKLTAKSFSQAMALDAEASKRQPLYGQMLVAAQAFTPGATGEIRLKAQKILKDIGVDWNGAGVPSGEALQRLGRRLELSLAKSEMKGEGSVTENERKIVKEAIVDLSSTPEGLVQGLNYMKRLDDYDRQVAKLYRDNLRANKGSLNAADLYDEIAKLGPAMSPQETAALEALGQGRAAPAQAAPAAPAPAQAAPAAPALGGTTPRGNTWKAL